MKDKINHSMLSNWKGSHSVRLFQKSPLLLTALFCLLTPALPAKEAIEIAFTTPAFPPHPYATAIPRKRLLYSKQALAPCPLGLLSGTLIFYDLFSEAANSRVPIPPDTAPILSRLPLSLPLPSTSHQASHPDILLPTQQLPDLEPRNVIKNNSKTKND